MRASWTFPIVGAVIGLIGALAGWLADSLGLHPFISGTLAVAATVLVTGCLHEDGLADMVDGFGGGGSPVHKLEIMRDSRVGAYGTSALILSFMLRAGAIASLADPAFVAPALIAAHAGARAIMPAFMLLVPPARQDGRCRTAAAPRRLGGGADRHGRARALSRVRRRAGRFAARGGSDRFFGVALHEPNWRADR
jgi:adenosylcobinamide-GDP ribazoletransferase